MNVGVAGLGRMGHPMAARLLDAGFQVAVYNRTAGRTGDLAERGAIVVDSPAELAEGRGVLVTALMDPAAVHAVVDGPDGLLRTASAGTVIADTSTIGPTAARALAARTREHDVEFLDAPVSGSVPAADAGTLSCFVGGSAEALARARPVLDVLTASVVHVGGSGDGAAVKLGLNSVLAALNNAIAETLVFAEAQGVAAEAMYSALQASAVAAPYLGYKRDAFLGKSRGDVAFTVSGLLKDMELVLSHGREHRVPLSGAATVAQALTAAGEAGFADADIADLVTALRQATASRAA
jgi:3-hydroxyisobutyrate dehydrogenase-like beta-hydroxyacid dehydrogenase